MNKTVPRALSAAHSVIDYFRQDERIDAADMGELSDYVQEHWREEVYSEEENALLQRVRQKFEGSLEERKWITLKVRRRSCTFWNESLKCKDEAKTTRIEATSWLQYLTQSYAPFARNFARRSRLMSL